MTAVDFADVRDAVMDEALARPETSRVTVSTAHTRSRGRAATDCIDIIDVALTRGIHHATWYAAVPRGAIEWAITSLPYGVLHYTEHLTDDPIADWSEFVRDCDAEMEGPGEY